MLRERQKNTDKKMYYTQSDKDRRKLLLWENGIGWKSGELRIRVQGNTKDKYRVISLENGLIENQWKQSGYFVAKTQYKGTWKVDNGSYNSQTDKCVGFSHSSIANLIT